MSRAFGMLVTTALATPRSPGTLTLLGPTVGIAPDAGSPLVALGAFGGSERMTFRGVEGPVRGEAGVRVALTALTPLAVTGAVVFEEGVACRVFGARLPEVAPPRASVARFELAHARAYGLVRTEGDLLTAFVIGGGLAMGADLWAELLRIVTLDGDVVARESLRDVLTGWPVAGWAPRPEDDTLLVTRPCGPARIGSGVEVQTAAGTAPGSVVNQQPQGVVHVRGPRGVKRAVMLPSAA